MWFPAAAAAAAAEEREKEEREEREEREEGEERKEGEEDGVKVRHFSTARTANQLRRHRDHTSPAATRRNTGNAPVRRGLLGVLFGQPKPATATATVNIPIVSAAAVPSAAHNTTMHHSIPLFRDVLKERQQEQQRKQDMEQRQREMMHYDAQQRGTRRAHRDYRILGFYGQRKKDMLLWQANYKKDKDKDKGNDKNNNKDKKNGKSSTTESYAPTINRAMVTLRTADRNPLFDCNLLQAIEGNESLEIGVPDDQQRVLCYPFAHPVAKKYLLKALAANKHMNPNHFVPPRQNDHNCWFNTMFVCFFVSDKGRKFFHAFRQMMIEGERVVRANVRERIEPASLREAFAVLNICVEASLTNNDVAQTLNTNRIIERIYVSLRDKVPPNESLYNVGEKGNPLFYFDTIVRYLRLQYVEMEHVLYRNQNDETFLHAVHHVLQQRAADSNAKPAHVVAVRVADAASAHANKPMTLRTKHRGKDVVYQLDSAILRNTPANGGNHFAALFTCNGKEMAYDGSAVQRLEPMEWKRRLNADEAWGIGDRGHVSRKLYNFRNGYSILLYYRVK